MRISVVIPVLEDRDELKAAVDKLRGFDELIVVDASRRDPVRAGDLPAGARLIRSAQAGRARQQNLGAGLAGGDAILFLHADTALPEGAPSLLRAALADPEVVGGGFERLFDSPSPVLRWTCRWGARRGRWWGWFLGDQALFVRRREFADLGGFRLLTAFEDYDLCRRLKRRGIMRCLRPAVISSARRFARLGPVRRTFRDLLLTGLYLVAGTRPFRDTEC